MHQTKFYSCNVFHFLVTPIDQNSFLNLSRMTFVGSRIVLSGCKQRELFEEMSTFSVLVVEKQLGVG